MTGLKKWDRKGGKGATDAMAKLVEKANARSRLEGRDGAHVNGIGETIPDPVGRPAHYTAHPSGIECIQIAEHFNFNLGNAIKYIWRAALKGKRRQDLEKARWYIDRELARLERGCDVSANGGPQ
jgi:uncharacterized protein DUF3310